MAATDNANPHVAMITPPPSRNFHQDLGRRSAGQSYSDAPANFCGYSSYEGTTTYTASCPSSAQCRATILPNRQAYQFCSTAGNSPDVHTAASPNWESGRACPTSALCCYGDFPAIGTNIFTRGGYTVTGFICEESSYTRTLEPVESLLNPSKFSVSLAKLAASTSSSSTSSASMASTSTTSTAAPGGSGGLSSGTVIGIGAGVGGGVGLALVCLIAFILVRRNNKKKARVAQVNPQQQQTSYYPQPPYSSQSHYSQQPSQYTPTLVSPTPPPQNMKSTFYDSTMPYAQLDESNYYQGLRPHFSPTGFSEHSELSGEDRVIRRE